LYEKRAQRESWRGCLVKRRQSEMALLCSTASKPNYQQTAKQGLNEEYSAHEGELSRERLLKW
jgi:hypothetical protein